MNTQPYTIDETVRIVRNAHTEELREACVRHAYELGKLAGSKQSMQIVKEWMSKLDADQKP